jgi:lipopolysaccharide/colanic/teichoic acid biosynthesis glycosyltransferase
MKRMVDLVLAVVLTVVLAPLWLAVALAVWLEDRGPLFYRQERIGRYGRAFRIWKFRTMCANADRIGPLITAAGDPRITAVGRRLRKWKLDEVPQLLNVLAGEMSFVGPRPEVKRYVDLYTPEQKRVLELRPGITDEASIAFRDEEALLAAAPDRERFYREYCMPRKIALNLAYAEWAGVLADFGVMFRTVFAVSRSADKRPL